MSDHWSSKGAICPHCDFENLPEDENWSLFDENTSEFECNDCGKEFQVNVIISYAWMTESAEDDHEKTS